MNLPPVRLFFLNQYLKLIYILSAVIYPSLLPAAGGGESYNLGSGKKPVRLPLCKDIGPSRPGVQRPRSLRAILL